MCSCELLTLGRNEPFQRLGDHGAHFFVTASQIHTFINTACSKGSQRELGPSSLYSWGTEAQRQKGICLEVTNGITCLNPPVRPNKPPSWHPGILTCSNQRWAGQSTQQPRPRRRRCPRWPAWRQISCCQTACRPPATSPRK